MKYIHKETGEEVDCILFNGHNQHSIINFAPKAYDLTPNGKIGLKGSSYTKRNADNDIILVGTYVCIQGKNVFGDDNVFALSLEDFHNQYTLINKNNEETN